MVVCDKNLRKPKGQVVHDKNLGKRAQCCEGFLLGAGKASARFPPTLSLLIVPSPLCVFRAVIIAQLSTASTFFTLLSWLPTFFKETFPESKVGWLRSGGIAVQRRPCWAPARRGWTGRKMMAEGFGEGRLGGRRRWVVSWQGRELWHPCT